MYLLSLSGYLNRVLFYDWNYYSRCNPLDVEIGSVSRLTYALVVGSKFNDKSDISEKFDIIFKTEQGFKECTAKFDAIVVCHPGIEPVVDGVSFTMDAILKDIFPLIKTGTYLIVYEDYSIEESKVKMDGFSYINRTPNSWYIFRKN